MDHPVGFLLIMWAFLVPTTAPILMEGRDIGYLRAVVEMTGFYLAVLGAFAVLALICGYGGA